MTHIHDPESQLAKLRRPKANSMVGEGAEAISVSRRTDIPAFYGSWFLDKLVQGRARYRTPFSRKIYEVELSLSKVLFFVFWSKNFQPFLSILHELEHAGYPFYCHYTITGLTQVFEPGVPAWQVSVNTFRTLSESYGPERIHWRFDPIVLSASNSVEATIQRFSMLCHQLAGCTTRCYISFIDFYKKALKNLAAFSLGPPSPQEIQSLISGLTEVAVNRGITLFSCCEPDLISSQINGASCLDLETARKITFNPNLTLEKRPTRKGCGCYASRDIGAYDTCPAGCRYCYANANHELAIRNHSVHNPSALTLDGSE